MPGREQVQVLRPESCVRLLSLGAARSSPMYKSHRINEFHLTPRSKQGAPGFRHSVCDNPECDFEIAGSLLQAINFGGDAVVSR
jgi:hypothetical protein